MQIDNITIYQVEKEIERIKDALKMVKGIPGNLIEVGVYEGGSAKLLAKAFPKKTVFLFDTFEGLPDKLNFEAGDTRNYFVGHAKAQEKVCRKYLKGCKNVEIFKGVFPESGGPVKNQKFCFAHIDVDIYESTKECLDFIYPRMSKGGIILVHDYPAHPGVQKAVDEFMADKTDPMRLEGEDIGLPRQLFITKQ